MRENVRILNWTLIPVLLLLISKASCHYSNDEGRHIQIPALGRTAELGFLYDEILDEFREVSIFKESIPSEFIITSNQQKHSKITGLSNSYQEKFKLLNIKQNTAAYILSGLTDVDGSASFLNEEVNTENEFSGILIQRCRTVKESLQIFFSNLTKLYSPSLLGHKVATHVLTGITWGGDVAVKFTQNSNNSRETTKALQAELKLISGAKNDGNDLNSPFIMSVYSDIPIEEINSTTDRPQIRELLQQVPNLISKINNGKGVPMKFTLTPLSFIKSFLDLNSKPTNFARELNEWVLKDIISQFDDLSSTERTLKNVYEKLNSQPNCLHPNATQKIKTLRKNFEKFKQNFTSQFKNGLVKGRSGKSPDSVDLQQLSEQYDGSEFNSLNIQQKISELDGDLTRATFCSDLELIHPSIEYFGTQSNLNLKLSQSQSTNHTVYVLLTKVEFMNEKDEGWQGSLKTFLSDLNRPTNKLIIVDCDFKQPMCSNFSQPVIQMYRNKEFFLENVVKAFEGEENRMQMEMSRIQTEINTLQSNLGVLSRQLESTNTAAIRNTNDLIYISRVTLGGRLDDVNVTIIETGLATLCSSKKKSFKQSTTTSATLNCGGIIMLPSAGSSILLDFKSSQLPGSMERCLWAFKRSTTNTRVFFKLKVTLLCVDSDEDAIVTVIEWPHGSGKSIAPHVLKTDTEFILPTAGVEALGGFLSYNSQNGSFLGNGFIARVDVVYERISSFSASNVAYTTSVGSTTYTPSLVSDLSSIIINPQPVRQGIVTVEYVNFPGSSACGTTNSIDILEIGLDGRPNLLGRLCGSQSNISYTAEGPILALFFWSGNDSGRTMKLSWK